MQIRTVYFVEKNSHFGFITSKVLILQDIKLDTKAVKTANVAIKCHYNHILRQFSCFQIAFSISIACFGVFESFTS